MWEEHVNNQCTKELISRYHTHKLQITHLLDRRVHSLLHDHQLLILLVTNTSNLSILRIKLVQQAIDLVALRAQRVFELGDLPVQGGHHARHFGALCARRVLGALIGEHEVTFQAVKLFLLALHSEERERNKSARQHQKHAQ